METLTITKKVFNTLTDLLNNTDQQITGQQLINRRVYLKGEGWANIEFTDELREQICNDIAETLGGRNATKQSIKNTLRYGTPQHWGLSRILLSQYGNGTPRLKYCAGQDYRAETKAIRNYLK